MKEGIIMKTIKCYIELIEGKQNLVFEFTPEKLYLNLEKESSEEIRKLFVNLLNKLLINEFNLEFVSKGKDLFNEVAENYIINLDNEISKLITTDTYGKVKAESNLLKK